MIVDVHNPGAADQTVSFTPIQGVVSMNAGLDDVIKTNADSGTFYIVALGNAFGQVDPHTGTFTPLVTAANAPNGTFGSVHGVAFVADHHDDTSDHHDDTSEGQHPSGGDGVGSTTTPTPLVGIVSAHPDGLHLV